MKIKKETLIIKIDPVEKIKGRIEPGTRHGSRPHKNKKAYSRKGRTQGE